MHRAQATWLQQCNLVSNEVQVLMLYLSHGPPLQYLTIAQT